MSNDTAFAKLTSFLDRLSRQRIVFSLTYIRENSIMVSAAVPGQRWEVEFFTDGTVEVERFMANKDIEGEDVLEELFKE